MLSGILRQSPQSDACLCKGQGPYGKICTGNPEMVYIILAHPIVSYEYLSQSSPINVCKCDVSEPILAKSQGSFTLPPPEQIIDAASN